MTDSQITQCPKCDTTFRITPAQLKVAKGAVRCGACLHVFRASDHFQATKKSEPEKKDDRTVDMFGNEAVPKEPVKKAPTQNPAPEKPQADETKTSRTIAEPDTGILDELSDSGLIEDEDDFLIDDDNGLIDDELIDDGAEKDKGLGELNEEFLSLDADDLSNPFHGDVLEQQESIKAESEDDEDWAQALLNDAEDEEVISAAQAKPPKPKPKPQPKPQSKGSADDDGIALGQPAGNQFSFIQQDPLDLALPEKKSKLPFFIWSLVSLLLLATLVGQAAYLTLIYGPVTISTALIINWPASN